MSASLHEFDLIQRYFTAQRVIRDDVVVAIGDDAAIVRVPSGMELAIAVDTLVEGVHFPAGIAATHIGYKALAVNLSDMAAVGAQPAWATLALTLPQSDAAWLADFCAGFFALAEKFNVALVGGDTTRGPLTLSVQILGLVPSGQALKRSGARPGDLICVTGTIGDAGLGLLQLCHGLDLPPDVAEFVVSRLHRPEPRVALGLALRGVATAAIDISDGLFADLNHLLEASGVGAIVDLTQLPLSVSFKSVTSILNEFLATQGSPSKKPWELYQLYAGSAGDDYELCFTLPPHARGELDHLAHFYETPITVIGVIEAQSTLRALIGNGDSAPLPVSGYQHF